MLTAELDKKINKLECHHGDINKTVCGVITVSQWNWSDHAAQKARMSSRQCELTEDRAKAWQTTSRSMSIRFIFVQRFSGIVKGPVKGKLSHSVFICTGNHTENECDLTHNYVVYFI